MAVAFCGRRLLLARKNIIKTHRSLGYIVLLPEIGEDLPEKNPLLIEDTKLPDFTNATFERCISAVNKQSVEFEQNLRSLEKDIQKKENFNIFSDLIYPLEEIQIPLESTWGVNKILYFGDKRRMPGQCFPNINSRLSAVFGQKYVSRSIYEACKNALSSGDYELTKEQERLLSKFILEGKLNGLELKTKRSQEMLADAYYKIIHEGKLFRQRIEAKLIDYSMLIQDRQMMKDFPEDFLIATADNPKQPFDGPWRIGLHPYTVSTFLEYCSDNLLRKQVWRDNSLKCSLYGESELKNSTCLEDIRHYRNEAAVTLGYKTFAHMSMETKMAGSLQNVYDFLDNLLKIARPAQESEIAELNKFAKERGFDQQLNHWDVPYWARKQRRAIYKYEENLVQEYFPLPKVMECLFQLSETLFNLKIVEDPKPNVWQEDVRLFHIFDLDQLSADPISSFYFDPYIRNNKTIERQYSGWMVGLRNRSRFCGINPLAALIFNFLPPTEEKPSLLRFCEVEDLFRKFGRALQFLLTKANYTELAGLSNVEWDAVDVSSYFMANWIYEPTVLSKLSGHYKTGEPLPEETIENIRSMRTFMAGYRLCNDLYLSRYDLELHDKEEFWVQIMHRLWKTHFVIPEYKEDSHICSFKEIFSGGYGAAYYSSLYSEMIGADAFSAFQEIPVDDEVQQKLIGFRYRDTFLSLGGGCSASETFRKFRGRDPNIKALLKNLGLKEVAPEKQATV